MPFFRLIAEPKFGDAIKCHRRHGTLRALASPNAQRFPSTTLIRLYELLKNDSRSFDRTGKTSREMICQCANVVGGGERDRTDDPLLAKQVLSQLSYTPRKIVVGLVGFEPTTPALSRRCSNRLSYRPSSVATARLEEPAPTRWNAPRPRPNLGRDYCRQRQTISVGVRD